MKPADPIAFAAEGWPDVRFYTQQEQVIYSVVENDETFVPAGNMLGKDYVAGYILLWFFLTRHPVRIVSSSAKEDHLRVLWGEVGNFISTCRWNLKYHKRLNPLGPLIYTHQQLKKVIPTAWNPDGTIARRGLCDKSYAIGMVASADRIAAMGGHHIANQGDGIPRTLFLGDECSSMPSSYKDKADTWANRLLFIGNTWPCNNFWKDAIDGKPDGTDPGGDLPRPAYIQVPQSSRRVPDRDAAAAAIPQANKEGLVSVPQDAIPREWQDRDRGGENQPSDPARPRGGYYRKVIRIQATDSPNIRLAHAQLQAGRPPTGEMLIPGVKSWDEYQKNLARWDDAKQAVALRAEFYKGPTVMLFPEAWQAKAMAYWRSELGQKCRAHPAEAIGIDPAEGGDKTSMCAGNRYGVKELVSKKTPDTDQIVREAIAFMGRHGVPAEMVIFDRGGGGKQHADRMRAMGYRVRTIAFGESLVPDPKRGITVIEQRLDIREDHYAYVNRRAEMYGELRLLIDPSQAGLPQGDGKGVAGYWPHEGFCLPPGDQGQVYQELHRQMKPIPLTYDPEGRLKLLPKNKKTGDMAIREGGKVSSELTLVELLGCSPDETDSVVLMVHALLHRQRRNVAGGRAAAASSRTPR